MKPASLILLFVVISIATTAQQPIFIDHNCLNLNHIPDQWIGAAKENLHIGYGHTSHGSQLTSGMIALESFYPNGKYNWSHSGGPGELHLFEGAGYGTGYLELDCGYNGWADQTRTYLNDFPDCNVIIWSWCGQVNDVNLQSHYFQPMALLEAEYPDVQFVYMTGHLEGLGPQGSLLLANQQIRDYCQTHQKILFDFADIEKYSPACDTNFQQYFANDACDYQHPMGGTSNWAYDWMIRNPNHELTQIADMCGSCAHSVSLNCVKKGIACWFLWARLAGWDGQITGNNVSEPVNNFTFLNPVGDYLEVFSFQSNPPVEIEIRDLKGNLLLQELIDNRKINCKFDVSNLSPGVYFLIVKDINHIKAEKVVKL